MTFDEIFEYLQLRLDITSLEVKNAQALQPQIEVKPEYLPTLCQFLRDDERLYFDYLACLTAIDNGPEKDTLEVIYHLSSLVYEHNLVLKTTVSRALGAFVPTVSTIWRTADWHEREAFDLVGVCFEAHPDLRRILLPNDWEGHPLRKDYEEQTTYHGIKVKY
ncbi:MAG: NADH-quinone oxidoreductase subunit C [Runella sp.]